MFRITTKGLNARPQLPKAAELADEPDELADLPALPEEEAPVRRWETALVWCIAMLVLLAFVPHILDRLSPVTGDEPFYLVTTLSLLQDRDLDERNQWEQRDYWQFAPTCDQMRRPNWGNVGDPPVYNVSGVLAPGLRGDCGNLRMPEGLTTLPPHDSKGIKQPGQYTKHGVGLSFLIAPAYALGGRVLVVVFIVALAALVGVNMWLLAFETTGRRQIAWLTWAILLFSSPILCFAFLIFPATPAALLVVYSWRRLRLAARARQQDDPALLNGPLRALAIGTCIALLPWLHSVYLALSLLLFLYWLLGGRGASWRERGSWRELLPLGGSPIALASFFVPLILSGALFLAFYLHYYGTPLPNTQDHAGFSPPYFIPVGLLGLLFDQKYGLLIYAPLYLLALSGLWLLWRKTPFWEENAARRSDLIWLAAVAGPYVLVMSDYVQWWGEWGPPARYLMPILPLLAVPLSLALNELRGRVFTVFLGLAGAWTFAVSVLFMYNPHLMYNWQNLRPAISLLWLEANLNVLANAQLGRLFPSYVTNLKVNGDDPNWPAIVGWLIGAVLVAVLMLRSRSLWSEEKVLESQLREEA